MKLDNASRMPAQRTSAKAQYTDRRRLKGDNKTRMPAKAKAKAKTKNPDQQLLNHSAA
ncbi:hypothetical protein [Paraburkholderia caribensis]|uniref:hypothetical protein n=1 Tax=Paraburkholderia caribensis TaxID=75105 RepID=UPI0034D2B1C4